MKSAIKVTLTSKNARIETFQIKKIQNSSKTRLISTQNEFSQKYQKTKFKEKRTKKTELKKGTMFNVFYFRNQKYIRFLCLEFQSEISKFLTKIIFICGFQNYLFFLIMWKIIRDMKMNQKHEIKHLTCSVRL